MDQKISPLQLFSFVCRVLKAYEVCPQGRKSLRWAGDADGDMNGSRYVDAMFVCLLNELSWEEEKLFVKLELVQSTLVLRASHWLSRV